MPATHRVRLHSNGPALWPEHKPLEEVLELQATTPEPIWNAVYQGAPVAAGGSVFRRQWWRNQNRYDATKERTASSCVARWISWDTAMKDLETAAYTAAVVGELLADYRLVIRDVWRAKLVFPELPPAIEHHAEGHRFDSHLRGVIIEDRASGTSALQTLASSSRDWLAALLVPFEPRTDKLTRANQAAVWCKLGCVLLPEPSEAVPWLVDFETELFSFPNSVYKDQVDALAQLILWVENLLADGWRLRGGAHVQAVA